MNCQSFELWLENRDLHDLSEADRAKRHAESCKRCEMLLIKDESLDRHLRVVLAEEPLPEGMRRRVDMSLERSRPVRRMSGVFATLAVACLVIGFAFMLGQRPDFSSLDQLSASLLDDHLDHVSLDIYEEVNDPSLWLSSNLDRAVDVPDNHLLAGYRVKGARFCTLEECQVVHMIYAKGDKLVSVFVVDGRDTSFRMKPGQTYTIGVENSKVTLWKSGGNVYAMVA